MPLMAQDCPAKADCCPKHPGCFGMMHRPHGHRPELTDEQKAEMKAKFEARRAEMLARFDADKDGKLSCEEPMTGMQCHLWESRGIRHGELRSSLLRRKILILLSFCVRQRFRPQQLHSAVHIPED